MARYIDADGLSKIKFHPLPYQYVVPSDVDKESYVRGWNDVIDGIIEEMPTADVVERKRGEWRMCTEAIEETFHIGCRCTVCNYWKPMGIWNYCPSCGADMRERSEDE